MFVSRMKTMSYIPPTKDANGENRKQKPKVDIAHLLDVEESHPFRCDQEWDLSFQVYCSREQHM